MIDWKIQKNSISWAKRPQFSQFLQKKFINFKITVDWINRGKTKNKELRAQKQLWRMQAERTNWSQFANAAFEISDLTC